MPRKRSIVRDQQIYKLAAYGAVVTIDYDVANPPPFFQPGPGVVIVGDHQCAPPPMVLHDPGTYEPPFTQQPGVPRGGNFGFDANDPAYLAFQAQQRNGVQPAPAGISPTVLTSEELFGMKPGSGELTALLGAPVANGDAEAS